MSKKEQGPALLEAEQDQNGDHSAIRMEEEGVLVIENHAVPSEAKEEGKSADVTEHLLTTDQVVDYYQSNMTTGLPEKLRKERLERDGLNQLTPAKGLNPFKVFGKHLIGPFSILLWLASIGCFILFSVGASIASSSNQDIDYSNLYLGCILVFVVLFNSVVESVQEIKTDSVLKSFGDMIPQKTMVLRDGNYILEESKFLVKGDVIKFKEGDKIPADIRIMTTNHCKVDNSSLTGEAEPILRATSTSKKNPLEAENLAFYGTLCVSGEASGIVIRCGDNSVIGGIAKLSNSSKKRASPLNEEIGRFVKLVAFGATIMAVLFFIIGMVINPNPYQNFQFFIGIFVANVPQGLPVTVTLVLTFAAKKLAKRNVLVKDLEGLDTLGAITLLASDKTGTMTQNRMTVVNFWKPSPDHDGHYFSKPGHGLTEQSREIDTTLEENRLLISCAALNRKAEFDPLDKETDIEKKVIFGDATECGILRFVSKNLDFEQFKNTHEPVFTIPFNSGNKWALTINKFEHANGKLCLFIKGAPERVLRMCSKMKVGSQEVPLPNDFQSQFDTAYKVLAGKGQRVLAFACCPLDASYGTDYEFKREPANYPVENYTFLGILGLMDPPKDRVNKAIASCQTAGIRVFMVTGDHPLTAEAIARQVGLLIGETKEQASERLKRPIESIAEDEYRAVVVHGEKLDKLSNREWDKILNKKEVVFARTSPKQKLEIVARCQAKGHVVGVTGDGVNDSPALKRADLGISMNISGSDVSKEAAKMILMDDNFATIVEGIAQGRLIFANLKKAIYYTICHLMAENVPFLLYIILPLPIAVTAFLIIFIDLFTDAVPATTYAYEIEEANLMSQAPRRTVTPPERLIAADEEDARNLSRVPSFRLEEAPRSKSSKNLWHKFVDQIWTRKRHPNDDSLVDQGMIFLAYAQIGILESIGGLFAFFMVFAMGNVENGKTISIPPSEIWNHRDFQSYDNPSFSEAQYQSLYREATSAYFMIIVISQMFNCIMIKIKSDYIFTRKIFINWRAFASVVFSLAFACFIVYTPFMQIITQSNGVRGEVYAVGVITGVVLVLYDTLRKFLLKLGYFGGINARPADKIEGISRVLTR
eukprot:NODE_32_length_37098_cov_1.132760.p2 type:complete len:1103 gc:universal NODE_32_length_37098_cov_1.132760:638-3946(+)